MRFLKHKEIDQKKWDQKILQSEFPLVFAQSFYLNACAKKWCALVAEDYSALMPLPVKQKFGFKYIAQPPFTSQLGVFGTSNPAIECAFVAFIKNKFSIISLELNAKNTGEGKDFGLKKTYFIDLKQENQLNTNTKRNIAKAQKLNLVVEEILAENVMNLNKHYLHPFLRNQLNISKKHVKIFDKLLEAGQKEKYLKTFCVYNAERKVLALAHFISNGKHAVYLKGSNFDKEENSGSMHLLMQYAIAYYRKNNNVFFDFGGGQKSSLARFFAGFGAKEMFYPILKINKISFPFFNKSS